MGPICRSTGQSQSAAVVMSSLCHAVKCCFVLLFTLKGGEEREEGREEEEKRDKEG